MDGALFFPPWPVLQMYGLKRCRPPACVGPYPEINPNHAKNLANQEWKGNGREGECEPQALRSITDATNRAH